MEVHKLMQAVVTISTLCSFFSKHYDKTLFLYFVIAINMTAQEGEKQSYIINNLILSFWIAVGCFSAQQLVCKI